MHFALPRRIALASIVAFLSLAGHAAGQGGLPGTVGLAIVILLATALAIPATRHTRSFGWLVAYLLAAQLLIHAMLVFAVPHAHGMPAMPLVPTGAMAASHVIASIVAASLLAAGEQTLSAWGRLLSSRLDWALPCLATPDAASPLPIDSRRWFPVVSDDLSSTQHRGPPLLSRA